MESTNADVKQLFNVKALAFNTDLDALTDGQTAIFAEGTSKSIAENDPLPDAFRILSKLGGKVYTTFDTVEKNNIRNLVAKEYKPEKVNIWKALIDNCKCIKDVELIVNIDETSLKMRDGLTWTHRDLVVAVSSEDLDCACDATGLGTHDAVLENNILTNLLVKGVNDLESDFYFAKAQKADGTDIEDIEAFIIANNKEAGADPETDPAGAKEKIYLVLEGIKQDAKPYRDLDINYIYPRGVRLTPALRVDGKVLGLLNPITQTSVPVFEEVQKLAIEVGNGSDLRAFEFDNMSYYTNLNGSRQLCDGIADPNLVYQFENGVNYHTVNFEFTTDNVETNSGRKRLFGVFFGTQSNDVFTKIKTIFGLS